MLVETEDSALPVPPVGMLLREEDDFLGQGPLLLVLPQGKYVGRGEVLVHVHPVGEELQAAYASDGKTGEVDVELGTFRKSLPGIMRTPVVIDRKYLSVNILPIGVASLSQKIG